MNAGIIVAGGKGNRYGGFKQTIIVKNKPLYQYSLDVFNNSTAIDFIYLVVPIELFEGIKQELSRYNSNKPIILCEGGKTRSDSVYNAIKKIDKEINIVFIHDAARPLIKNEYIDMLLAACKTSKGAILARPVSDTIKKVKNNKVNFTIDRNRLFLAETPQAFSLNVLKSCFEKTNNSDRKVFTDEASMLEFFKHEVSVVNNQSENIKITDKEDLQRIKTILLKNDKVGIGIDFHSLIEGKHLTVGGHKIDCLFSSDAHSDGDVLTHAITDALLGALNLGDIGEHFPNNPEYLNIPSTQLLKKILKKIPETMKISMIDASIVLNSPKLSPHKKAIKTSLSKVMGVSEDIISIKATTTNGLKFVDMSNGWGCEAIIALSNEN